MKNLILILLVLCVGVTGLILFLAEMDKIYSYSGVPNAIRRPMAKVEPEPKSTEPTPTTAVYRDGKYGFEVTYPIGVSPETTFKSFYHLSDKWTFDALPNSLGLAIVSFPVYRLDGRTAYPRYYSAELRIGASTSTRDVANCLKVANARADGQRIINGTNFAKFQVSDAGMMQYLEGVSYRAVHQGVCFALEALRAGSNYRDATSTEDITQNVLDANYNSLEPILSSFRFIY